MTAPPAPPTSLYVHVPLCRAKCAYCDFFSVPLGQASEGFVEALVDATLARARALSERFGAASYRTVYVGGGTPTALPLAHFRRLLRGLRELAPSPSEWTVEANPESLDEARLDAMREAGVTRLSLGVQSLDEGLLATLRRPHGAARALKALELAAGSGLALSADLIAGLPSPGRGREAVGRGGRPRDLGGEAARLVELGARHLSIYDLVVEEGTPIASSLASGELAPMGEDEAWEEGKAARNALAARGFRRYEVSNFAREGTECAHNLAYWRMDSYVGAGPGAVSTLQAAGGTSIRVSESRELGAYAGSAAELAGEEVISRRESAFEAMMMGFRTRFGLDLEAFASRFGVELGSLVPESLAAWSARLEPGWGGGRRLALDEGGLDLQNRFLTDCLGELEREGDRAFPDDQR